MRTTGAVAILMTIALTMGGTARTAGAQTTGTQVDSAQAKVACAGNSDFDGDGVDDVVVGDPFADGGKGAVHVISGNGDKVIPVTVPGLQENDAFGWSVGLAKVDPDNACADLVVGAPYADVDGVKDAGAVYVVYGGGSPAPVRLVAPQPQRFAHFGWSLATRGNVVVIGAPYEDQAQVADAGSVYVREGTGKLIRINQDSVEVPGNGEVGDQFGWSLALAPGNRLLVGVPYENDDGAGRQVDSGKTDSGSIVRIDDVLASRYTGVKFDSPTSASGDRFGYSVAYSEGNGYAVTSPGKGYVQFLDGNLKPGRRVSGGTGFGFSMAASPDGKVAVGSPYKGEVRVLSFKNASEDRKLPPSDGLFGWSLTYSGNKLFIGQPDSAPAGQVSILAKSTDELRQLAPPAGADFGTAVAG
ncbi:FG-GAP repeat protein [Nonomuraea rhizosphaerae]|uniref:FG-GAP repeat protein n=1 Tax=Nonomuraea rhizosphaerae TaxID=2665663 RepID=UPI001C5D6510|nr:FG-GAP repeat protein [Nonomuraea rhizosphaerae]